MPDPIAADLRSDVAAAMEVTDSLLRRIVDALAAAVRRHTAKVFVTIGVLLFFVVYFAPSIFITIHSGEVGVLYHRFGGTVTESVMGEGLKMIWPWDHVYVYDTRLQEVKHTMKVLTSEGLPITLHLSIRFRPELETIGLLHEKVGPDYVKTIVIPEVESELRTVMGQFSMRDVYGAQQGLVQRVINDSLEQVSQNYVRIDDVLLVQVELPPSIRKSVEAKMTEKERAESYEYRLAAEKSEAERREIDATGLQKYNQILSSSLTPSILEWKGIQATEDLAKSPNTKTVIVGSTKNGLPLILPDGSGQE
jgi:regulator of protease activity HflC (stomatin/prohibitin superfamily)